MKQEIIFLKAENGSLKRENSFLKDELHRTKEAHFKEKQDLEIKLKTLEAKIKKQAPVSNGPHLSNNANKFGPKRNLIFPPKSRDAKQMNKESSIFFFFFFHNLKSFCIFF